jgi:acetolactate synthase small subunit
MRLDVNKEAFAAVSGSEVDLEKSRYRLFLNEGHTMHRLSIKALNQLGLLGRVAQIFTRRGFMLQSLVFSQSQDRKFVEIDIHVEAKPRQLTQIMKDVQRMVGVNQVLLQADFNKTIG